MRILLFLGAALIATLPGMLVAYVYLRMRNIEVKGDIINTFMTEATGPVKAAVIGLNFLVFGAICALGWFGLSLLEES